MDPKRGRDLWYPFFADLGFLILPCGFNWKSTTLWLFERAPGETNEMLSDERYLVTHTGMHYFFYHVSRDMLRRALDTMMFTERLIRGKLRREHIDLDARLEPHYRMENGIVAGPERSPQASLLRNVARFERKPYLGDFSLFRYLTLLAAVVNEIDPLDWTSDGVKPDHLVDFDTYGLCFLDIERRQ